MGLGWIVICFPFFSVPYKVGFKGTDLWQAVLKGDMKKVDKLLKSGADITFMKDNKPMINMVRELEASNQTTGDAAKLYYYGQIKGMLELRLNSSVGLNLIIFQCQIVYYTYLYLRNIKHFPC